MSTGKVVMLEEEQLHPVRAAEERFPAHTLTLIIALYGTANDAQMIWKCVRILDELSPLE